MFDVLLFLGFASLIIRFSDGVSRTMRNIDATKTFITQAQQQLQK